MTSFSSAAFGENAQMSLKNLIPIIWSCTRLTLWCLQLNTAQINDGWPLPVHCGGCFTTSGSSHTFKYLSPQLGEAAVVQGSDKVVCACFILVTQDGPMLLCLEMGEGRVCVCVSHSSGEPPSALSSPSIPYCKCPRLELDPWTHNHVLPSSTHTHTQSSMYAGRLQCKGILNARVAQLFFVETLCSFWYLFLHIMRLSLVTNAQTQIFNPPFWLTIWANQQEYVVWALQAAAWPFKFALHNRLMIAEGMWAPRAN